MSAVPGDFGLLSPVTADPRRQSVTGDGAVVAAVLAVETAWVQVLESTGLAPAGSAATIREAANGEGFQAAGLAAAAQGGGNPVIPIVAKLRSLVSGRSPEAAAAVHASLTSQDVLDTALMLLASNAVAMLRGDVAGASAAMARLARAHAGTLQPARTLTQHSLPSTFGLKAAQWFHGLAAAATRLDAITFPVQFGGAAGTLAAGTVLAAKAGTDPFTLADSLAGNLGLAAAPAPWHTNRTQVTALGDALAALTDAAGKVANDVLLLSRPEFGELAEPRAAGRGVSSAMPQKQNPVLSILVRSAALAAPQQAAQLHLAAALSVDERPDGAWHTEWNALRTLLELAGGAAAALHELAAGLQVFPDAMRRNLAISGPLLLSEAAGAAVVPLLESQGGTANPRKGGVGNAPGGGKAAFQAIVDRALQAQAGTQGTEFARLLRAAVPETALADAELDRLLDPAGYLGENSRIVERIFAAYPQWVPEGGGHE